MIDRRTLFETWAQPGEFWSGWVKPILFAHWPRDLPKMELLPASEASWAPPPSDRLALMVEMPGPESVSMSLALAEVGYRPVLIFNASPPPTSPRHPMAFSEDSPATVDVESILAAIARCAEPLSQISLPSSAPPAFIIDQHRSTPDRWGDFRVFDNRSWIYSSDVPSAGVLAEQGIQGLVLYRVDDGRLAEDLGHVLRIWSRQGLALYSITEEKPGRVEPLKLPRPSWLTGLRMWFYRSYRHQILGHGYYHSGSSG